MESAIISSFVMAAADQQLNAIVPVVGELPDDTDSLEYVARAKDSLAEPEQDLVAHASLGEMRRTSAPEAAPLSINGFYEDADQLWKNADLSLGTADGLRLANYAQSNRVAIIYRRGIPGDGVRHIAQILKGMQWYLEDPAVETAHGRVENGIREVVLMLHAGALGVWERRFAPYLENRDKFRLVVECLNCLDDIAHEASAHEEANAIHWVALSTAFGTKFATASEAVTSRLLKHILEYIDDPSQRHPLLPVPRLSTEEATKVSQKIYESFLQRGDLEELRLDPWQETTIKTIHAEVLDYALRIKETIGVSVEVSPEEIAPLAEELRALGIPEFAALTPQEQDEVARRIIKERKILGM
ncbi:MAG: hypothetical protein WC690_01745 [bacterium]